MDGLCEKLVGKTLPEIKVTALKYIEELSPKNVSSSAKKYGSLYELLILGEIVGEFEIDIAFEKSIIKQAKNDYKFLKESSKGKIPIFPEDLQKPECFAYAIMTGEISKDSLFGLRFNCNVDEFVSKYGRESLPQRLRYELLKPDKQTSKTKIRL